MDCSTAHNLMPDLAAGLDEVSQDACAAFESHLAACAECREAYALVQSIGDVLRQDGVGLGAETAELLVSQGGDVAGRLRSDFYVEREEELVDVEGGLARLMAAIDAREAELAQRKDVEGGGGVVIPEFNFADVADACASNVPSPGVKSGFSSPCLTRNSGCLDQADRNR